VAIANALQLEAARRLWCCWHTCIINKAIRKQNEVTERCRLILGACHNWQSFLRGAWTPWTELRSTWRQHWAI